MTKRIHFDQVKTFCLIREVKSRPCLWDPDNEEYNEKYSMAKAWDEISAITDLPSHCLKYKWKILRDTYRKKFKKCNGHYTGSWNFYEELKFLVFKPTNENEAVDEQADRETYSDEGDYCEVKYEPLEPNVESYSFEEDPIAEKMRKADDDEYDEMFLESLTPYFRQLGPMRQLVVRNQMQELLLNELAAQNVANGWSEKF